MSAQSVWTMKSTQNIAILRCWKTVMLRLKGTGYSRAPDGISLQVPTHVLAVLEVHFYSVKVEKSELNVSFF